MQFSLAFLPSAPNEIELAHSIWSSPRTVTTEEILPSAALPFATSFDRSPPSVSPPSLRTHRCSTQHTSLIIPTCVTGGFLERGDGNSCIITGAGVSVDSGIRAYRGKHGSYTRAGKEHRPIFFHEFQSSEKSRRRCQFGCTFFKRAF